jgi:hypothetical protein
MQLVPAGNCEALIRRAAALKDDLPGSIKFKVTADAGAAADVGDGYSIARRLQIIEVRRRMISQALLPICSQSLATIYSRCTAASAFDSSGVGIKAENSFKVAGAISIEPINYCGHRVKGHLPHLLAKSCV